MAAIELKSKSLFSDANLKAYWRFEGNSNDSKDSQDGTDTSMTYGTSYGKFGQGAHCDGSLNKIMLPSGGGTALDITATFTFCCWVKTSAVSGLLIMNGDGWNGGNGWYMGIGLAGKGDGKLAIGGNGGWVDVGSSGTVNDGNWHHVAFVWVTGGAVKYYIDGIASGTGTLNVTPLSHTGYRSIGVNTDGTNFGTRVTGDLDDMAMFDRELTAAEISNLYDDPSVMMFIF